jgi:5-amino-6-(5-phospho-D-ribitylamino)uracil phosphatase
VIRLLAVDIDGTLLDSRGRIPDSHRDALVEAADRGVEIALVTGRSFHFSRPIADALPLRLTLIVNNGALVKDKSGRAHVRRLLPRDTARLILERTRAYEDSVALVFDRPAGVDERQVVFERMDWNHPNRRGYYEKNRAFIAQAPATLAEMLTEDPVQVMFNGSVEPMRQLVADLRALPAAADYSVAVTEYAHRDFSLVDVNCAGCTKGSTLAQYSRARGLTPGEVLAIGDNLNDVEMLEFAGTAVVMGNATADLKSRGWHVTGTNDEGGLADAIRRFTNPA